MSFENWDEIRTAYQVARLGTVSGAAEVLGVHHATVIRHIDALERRLGVRLFQRHPRGYAPTEAGQELLTVAQVAEDKFAQLSARISGTQAEISGDLTVTALPNLSSFITPALVHLAEQHPTLRINYLSDNRVYRLEVGEAHVAVRAGVRPQDPDYVVQALSRRPFTLYAARRYVTAHGLPQVAEGLSGHRFVGPESEDARAPFYRWMAANVPRDDVVFRSNDQLALGDAVHAGVGLGFLPVAHARAQPDLVEVTAPLPEWEVPIWLVTHVDLHRTPKVQAFLAAMKAAARQGESDI